MLWYNTYHSHMKHCKRCKSNGVEKELTSSLMCDMSEESCNLWLRSIIWTKLTELRIWIEGIKKCISCIEVFPSTTCTSLTDYAIEETRCNNVSYRSTTATRCARWGRTGPLFTSLATVGIASATVAILATAEVCCTATTLSLDPFFGHGSCKDYG